jgi:hypothetical protein
MFKQAFKNIDDILYKNAGADSELDYIEQTYQVLFLPYLNHLESEKVDKAALEGTDLEYILNEKYHCHIWAIPHRPGIKTLELFFTNGEPTLRQDSGQNAKIWYYQLNPLRKMGKSNSPSGADMRDFFTSASSLTQNGHGPETPNLWNVDTLKVAEPAETDLSVKNLKASEKYPLREPVGILQEIQDLDKESAKILNSVSELI